MSVPRCRGLLVDDPLASGEYRNQARSVTGGSEVASRLRDIPIGEIRANPEQPRKRFDDGALEALADSIHGRAVLQPVIVRPVDGRFELVVGERRWRAAELAGKTTIPALVDDELDQAGTLELALIENIVREDISPIEQARAFSVLLDDQRMTLAVLSRRIGRSRPDIANTVRLLDLPDAVVELIESGSSCGDGVRPAPRLPLSSGSGSPGEGAARATKRNPYEDGLWDLGARSWAGAVIRHPVR